MSTSKTENYQLHAWELGDDFLLQEINENFALLDTAARVVIGAYSGDGKSTQDIELGFRPRALLIADKEGMQSAGNSVYGGFYTEKSQSTARYVQFTEFGFQVRKDSSYGLVNEVNRSPYVYLAIL